MSHYSLHGASCEAGHLQIPRKPSMRLRIMSFAGRISLNPCSREVVKLPYGPIHNQSELWKVECMLTPSWW